MYSLSNTDLRILHNANCTLYHAIKRLEGTLHPDLMVELQKGLEELDAGLADVRAQSDAIDREEELAAAAAGEFLAAVWSIPGVKDFSLPSRYTGVRRMRYKTGNGVFTLNIPSEPTWQELYVAANELIMSSGDMHHVFIEDFIQEDDVLTLSTGS